MNAAPNSPAAIALNRFGLGARPGDVVSGDFRHYLAAQFERYDPAPTDLMQLPDAGLLLQNYQAQQRAMRQEQAPVPSAAPGTAAKPPRSAAQQAARKDYVQEIRALYRQAVQARLTSALVTEAPFIERMVHFWSNHFCVSADNPQVLALAGAFERDAIRPHVLGRFEDMLLAVEQHPAMLVYLNQAQSTGPNSPAAQRSAQRTGKARGLNENLAREILELHTLGVRSGYSQADVTEFARALTGWSVAGLGARATDDGDGLIGFQFRAPAHEPGERTILGRRYDQSGERQAYAVLTDLAKAPQTAHHIAAKLARHFAGDTPPDAMIDRLAESFARSGGDLKALYNVLIHSPEVWAGQPAKFKTPWEWTVSALRGLSYREAGKVQVAGITQQLGQPVWQPGSPAGWDDIAATWAAPDALLRRVEIAQRLTAPLAGALDARSLAPQLLPGALAPSTAEQIAKAESPAVAIALLLVSPEFLRR